VRQVGRRGLLLFRLFTKAKPSN